MGALSNPQEETGPGNAFETKCSHLEIGWGEQDSPLFAFVHFFPQISSELD